MNPINILWSRWVLKLRREGWIRATGSSLLIFLRMIPRLRSYLYDWWFDLRRGVWTTGVVPSSQLEYTSEQRRHAHYYDTSRVRDIRTFVSQLPIDYGDFCFIDFGSGKGRVLLVAAEFGFRSVVGVELSRALHEIAVRNTRPVQTPPIETICCDAREYKAPNGNLVLYFFNPFDEVVLHDVLKRVLGRGHENQVWVIYVNPRHHTVLEEVGLSRVSLNEKLAVYRTESVPKTGRVRNCCYSVRPDFNA